MLLALLYQVVRYLTDLALVSTQSSWGYRRIQGEVLKLGFKISHMGVAKILRRQRIPPAPRRAGHRTWREFVRVSGWSRWPATWPPSRRGESHPPPPTEPDVSLSAHPARAIQPGGCMLRRQCTNALPGFSATTGQSATAPPRRYSAPRGSTACGFSLSRSDGQL